MKGDLRGNVVGIVGLGYVGLPLAKAFSQKFRVIGFDTDVKRLNQLRAEQSDNHKSSFPDLTFTSTPEEINEVDYIIICVPTPVTSSKEPDLSYVKNAAETVARHMKKGVVVILESTVFPGVTEEVVKPILEKISDLKCGQDFKIGYSPERVNPGDAEHTVDMTTKVVSGMDSETTGLIAELYRQIAADVFLAKDIKTAEAAKVIENIQRDLNIALVNELSMLFDKMGLSTRDVLETAATKWNFHRYAPGLVGGHCIPVDPYYLVHKAKEFDYHPQVVLAGRAINDSMPKHVAALTIRALNNMGKVIKGSKVLIMGLTYKENVPDTRESPVKGIIKGLETFGVEVFGYDPLLGNIGNEFNIEAVKDIQSVNGIDAVILAAPHDTFRGISLGELKKVMNDKPILIDVKRLYDCTDAEKAGYYYLTL